MRPAGYLVKPHVTHRAIWVWDPWPKLRWKVKTQSNATRTKKICSIRFCQNIKLSRHSSASSAAHQCAAAHSLGNTALNSQEIPANSSSSFHDKVIFQFILYYYEPSPNKLKSTPDIVDLLMDLLLSRPTTTGENQTITNLKPPISVNTTFTTKKTKICTTRLFCC